ncbi:MAG: DUF1178 family protein [Rhodospirillales bacterium]
MHETLFAPGAAAMIVYDLTCAIGHRFESWFLSAAAFDAQQREGVVSCPFCGNREVGKAPMAPRVARGTSAPAAERQGKVEQEPGSAAAGNGAGSGGGSGSGSEGGISRPPPAMIEMLRQLRRHIESNCDYVGAAFPEEARRIFYGERSPRDIYGEASAEEAAALQEGIETQRIPWLPRRDS